MCEASDVVGEVFNGEKARFEESAGRWKEVTALERSDGNGRTRRRAECQHLTKEGLALVS